MRVLRRHAEQVDYLENLLDQALAGAPLAPADRGLVQELTDLTTDRHVVIEEGKAGSDAVETVTPGKTIRP